jgi:hypothetical protein
MALTAPAKHERCDHPPHLREQRYPHGWMCGGCWRFFFFGLASDSIPQTLPPGDKERARLHNERKTQVAAEMLARGQTPPRA